MNKYKNLLDKNDLKVNKFTIKGKSTIINTPLGQFVLKKNNNSIYNYLLSRGFNYLPKIIDHDSESVLYEYLEEINYDINEKSRDFIKLLSLLHNKTSYYIDVVLDDYNKTYEDIKNRLVDLDKYYNGLINEIDMKEYLSPNEYLITRNISTILSSINFCFHKLDEWKQLVSIKNKKRVVTNYNNNKLDNMIRTIDNMYLISLDNTKVESPILDLVSFYNIYFNDFDFISLLSYYEKLFPLLEEEKELFIILISMPDKIIIKSDIDNIYSIKNSLNKTFKSLNILNFYKEKETGAHKDKNNK